MWVLGLLISWLLGEYPGADQQSGCQQDYPDEEL